MSRKSYVLSDIHIGDESPECGYQSSLHEPALQAILRHIAAQGEAVEDVVIAGDWLDLWAYRPERRPPSATEIMRAQPGLFERGSAGGDFVTLLDAIGGDLVFINGNHDDSLSLAELNAWFAPRSRKGRRLPGPADPMQNLTWAKDGLLVQHGHDHTLLFGPCPRQTRFGRLAAGHFVTRTLTLLVVEKLAKEKVAHSGLLAGGGIIEMGLPTLLKGIDNIAEMLLTRESIVQGVIEGLLQYSTTATPESIRFTLANGEMVDFAEVKLAFADLWDWSDHRWDRLRHETTNNLAEAGQELCGATHPVVVMGHTHVPMLQQFHSAAHGTYVNAGFESPALPDMQNGKKLPTFVEVERREGKAFPRLLKLEPITRTVAPLFTGD